MREEFETIEHAGLKIEIHQDMDYESPDAWGDDNLFLVGFHREFWVQRKGFEKEVCQAIANGGKDEYDEEHETAKEIMEKYHTFGLEAYIHSGVALALSYEGNFPDRRWDVSQLGLVFASKEEWPDAAKARKAAQGLIETWNQNLSGDVYGYIIKAEDGSSLPSDLVDSCWGFYGHDTVVSEAKSSAEFISKKIRERKEARLKALIRNKVPLTKRTLEV